MPDVAIIALIVSIIALIASIYIANRQGAFRKASIEIIPGISSLSSKDSVTNELKKRGTWAIICGIPPIEYGYFVSTVPYLIRNNGRIPLEDVLIQFSFNTKFFDENSWSQQLKEFADNDDSYKYGREIHVKHMHDTCIIDYIIPSIPVNEDFPLYSWYITAKDSSKKGTEDFNSSEVAHGNIEIRISSKTLGRPIRLNHWLIMSSGSDLKTLVKNSERTLYDLHKQECPNFIFATLGKRIYSPWPWILLYKLRFRDCKLKKRWAYITSSSVWVHPEWAKNSSLDIVFQDIESIKSIVLGYDETGFPIQGFESESTFPQES